MKDDFESIDYIKRRVSAGNDLSAKHGQILLDSLESQLTQTRAETARADYWIKKYDAMKAEHDRLMKRDGNATIIFCETTETIPFHQERLKIIDFGVSDNVYMVEKELEI